MAFHVLPNGFNPGHEQHKQQSSGGTNATVRRDDAPPRQASLDQEVEIGHSGEHLKQEDGEKGDNIVLGGDYSICFSDGSVGGWWGAGGGTIMNLTDALCASSTAAAATAST